jgi:hypothetical protein
MTKMYRWVCRTPKCPERGKVMLARGKGKKPGQWIYKAVICRTCKRICYCDPNQEPIKKYSLAELL